MEAPLAPRVPVPVMFHRWASMTFLHWPYAARTVQALLPTGLEVETVDGQAWVGLLPFRMQGVRVPGAPALPWLSEFPETNLRTYVRGPDGRSGIWFFSLDAARLPAVLGARASYGLPYFWSDMTVEGCGTAVRYRSTRRWPKPLAHCRAAVEVGAPLDTAALSTFDHFLTARYVMYTVVAGRLVRAHAEHEPWPLVEAQLLELDESLVTAAGLPAPEGPPVVQYSPGVSVRIGAWKPVSLR